MGFIGRLFGGKEPVHEREHKLLLALRKMLKAGKTLEPKDAADVDKFAKRFGYSGHEEMIDYARVANLFEGIIWCGGGGSNLSEAFTYDVLSKSIDGAVRDNYEISVGDIDFDADSKHDKGLDYWLEFELKGDLVINGKKYRYALGENKKDVLITGARTFKEIPELLEQIGRCQCRRGILAAFKVGAQEGADASESDAVLYCLLDFLMRKGGNFKSFLSYVGSKISHGALNARKKGASEEHKIFMELRKRLQSNNALSQSQIEKIGRVAKKSGYKGGYQEMLEYARVAEKLKGIVSVHNAGEVDGGVFSSAWPDAEFSAKLTGFPHGCELAEETEYYLEFMLMGELIINGKGYRFTLGKNDEDVTIYGARDFDDDEMDKLVECVGDASHRSGILAAFDVDRYEGDESSEADAVVCGLLGLLMKDGGNVLFNKFIYSLHGMANSAAEDASSSWNDTTQCDDYYD